MSFAFFNLQDGLDMSCETWRTNSNQTRKLNMKKPFLVFLTVLLACILLPAGTKYVSIFRSPKAGLNELSGKKIAAFVIIPSEELRSAREETVAAELQARGVNCVPGYTVLPGPLVKDRDKSKEFLKKAGVSGAIMFRLVSDQEATKVSAWYSQPYYSNFWGYWNYGWSSAYVYETTWTERVITLETLIYSIDKDELLWAGRSETTSPKDIKKFVKDLANAAGKELRKAGLVAK
jgi:hypothetical protein